ncbi:hypothetical protein BDW66DRAFT_155738 [Aspergillus desertorum]
MLTSPNMHFAIWLRKQNPVALGAFFKTWSSLGVVVNNTKRLTKRLKDSTNEGTENMPPIEPEQAKAQLDLSVVMQRQRHRFRVQRFCDTLASLRTLSISYSDRVINVRKEDISDTGDSADEIDHDASAVDDFSEDDDIEVEACDEANFLGLARLLKLCIGLENLELHHYAIPLDGYPYFDIHRDMFLQHLVATVQPPMLQRCTL